MISGRVSTQSWRRTHRQIRRPRKALPVTSADPWEFRRQDYSLDGDQQDVRDAFSEFFLKESSSSVVRAAEPLGYDARLWAALVGMGVTTMSLPAAAGGDG